MQRLGRSTDLIAAAVVVLVVVMMVVPLPPTILDFFITLNISCALAIVVTTLYVPRALDFSVFPSLLLLTTLFRLAINISVTRLILLHGDAGHVVEAFGHFVVGGNVVVGLIVFLILIVIQFVVVTNGAGRVAEVGARFTLDAMPGKQMAIDADLNSGQITEDEARKRRSEIAREADFYGAMDGASKFVKGDAIAAVLITLINLVGGIVVGVAMQGMPFGDAASHFSLLTVGDGLAAQIPALLISVATGIIVTRAAGEGDEAQDLGTQVAGQISAQQKAPMVAGVVICLFALIPGFPKLPFLLIGAGFILLGRKLMKEAGAKEQAEEAAAVAAATAPALPASPRDAVVEALGMDPLELCIGFGLVPMVDGGGGGSLLARVSAVRRQLASETGTIVPSVRIHDEVGLGSHEYVLKVRGSVVARGRLMAGHQLALDPGDAVGQVEGLPTTEPAFGLPAVWISDAARAEAEALGYTVVDAESIVVTHLTETIRRHVAELLTRQDTRVLLDRLKESNQAVVEEVVPDLLSVGELQRVLQALLREGVSIRDLGAIVEAAGDRARVTRDPELLAEHARVALSRAITEPYVDGENTLRALSLDPGLEQEVAQSIAQTPDGEYLAMDPSRAQSLLIALNAQSEQLVATGRRPVLLCSSRVRRHLRRLCEQALPQLGVCAYNEIAPGISVETIGVVNA
ncbi:flagellar biosynthesis protein FlhA [Conexibacter sp. SYSU D00693]|uniref:flagellar biosynthesis protein FlhA n=1 Tax=Conexibacter sp. SYSU D00693 TaxID=2812560 RepID=UPI001F119838|nr:flagellar biosynthesis protein FlhA [Conexibacter sp. SYSU D00693]